MTTSFTKEEVKLAVGKGINWLNENHPTWEGEIDLDTLDMNHCENCIIGQAVGDYYEMLDTVSTDHSDQVAWATEHGFCTPNFFTQEDGWKRWDLVTEQAYLVELGMLWSNEVRSKK